MDDVLKHLGAYYGEAKFLREDLVFPGAHVAPSEMHEFLLDVRRRLDRVEELLRRVLQLRGAVRRTHTDAAHRLSDAWDSAAVAARSGGAVRDEYSSAKEREAGANLAVLDFRRTERAAADVAKSCDDYVELFKIVHRGLADVRQDALAVLRHQQFESTLDR